MIILTIKGGTLKDVYGRWCKDGRQYDFTVVIWMVQTRPKNLTTKTVPQCPVS